MFDRFRDFKKHFGLKICFCFFLILNILTMTELQQQRLKSVRKQLGTKNGESNEGRQAKNGGVKERDGSAEEPDRETGEEQITVGWTRRKDGG